MPLNLDQLIANGLLIPEGRWYRVPAYIGLPEDVLAHIVGVKRSESATWVRFAEQPIPYNRGSRRGTP